MKFELMHPRDQIVTIMDRVYKYQMTTTSGGNISMMDEKGDIWISPSAVDKGTLRREDIVCIKVDGSIEGIHKPSSEYPFHKAIYHSRPDIRAIIHAHPPALVSFSIVRQIPDTRIIPQAYDICGTVGYAPYELPGSEKLGENIAGTFDQGYTAVLMENHGTVVGGINLLETFHRFETLEFCARIIIKSSAVGEVNKLTEEQISLFSKLRNELPSMQEAYYTDKEKEIRQQICQIASRAYKQRLMISTYGTISARIDEETFVITPYGVDRKYYQSQDLVQIKGGHKEKDKSPSRSVHLHSRIYQEHPEINSIITSQPPHAMAFCITSKKFDTRTIPESYILLRDIPVIPYGNQFLDGKEISARISKEHPIALLQNDALLVTGKSILEAFDRVEVAEFSAQSLIDSQSIGKLVPINEKEIKDLKEKFLK